MKPAIQLGVLFCLPAISALPLHGQQAPYVLPYTASTFAGPHAAYTVGQACGDTVGVALDSAGDGCNASVASIGIDPHDIVVDPQGNVYFEDNTTSSGVVHKISAVTHQMTIYAGSLASGQKPCTTGNGDKFGDGCIATDGAANATTSLFTAIFKASRGIGVAANGDVLIAGYNNSYDHKISAATGLMTVALGTGTAAYVDAVASKATVNGSRGITEDINGNIYIADTGNHALRVVYSGFGTIPPGYQYVSGGAGSTAPVTPVAGQSYSITGINTAGAKQIDNGIPAINALLNGPEDVEVDTNGNVYIADGGNAIIRAIYMGKGHLPGITAPITGYIYTIAGCPTGCTAVPYPKDGTAPVAIATTTGLNVRKIALDSRNNLYIADTSSNVVWFVDNTTGGIRLLFGNYGPTAGTAAIGCGKAGTIGDGCPGPVASLFTNGASNAGFGITPDNQGNLYVSDDEGGAVTAATNSLLRKLRSGLNFPTVTVGAASVTQTIELHFGVGDTPAVANAYNLVGTNTDFTLGTATCTLETDTTTDCLLPITFNPSQPGNDTATLTVISQQAGVGTYELTGYGSAPALAFDPGNIAAATATVNAPQGVTVDSAGNAYIADTANNRVLRRSAVGGAVTTFAGTGTAGYTGDNGAATAATLKGPRGVAIDTSGSVFITDTGNNVIRKVDGAGRITTYAGGGTVCALASNSRGDFCPALQATFSSPTGIAADNLGQIYVADTGNNVIRQITVSTNVMTLAGGATASTLCSAATDTQGDGCSASSTIFNAPTALAFDATGQNLFVADTGNHIVRKIYLANTITVPTPTSYSVQFNPVTLVAGNGQAGRSIDVGNVATLSQLSGPTGVAVDAAGNTYIADTGNHAVRLVSAKGGLISTIVGILGVNGTGTVPGSAVATQLNSPGAVAVSALGTLTVLDSGNNRVLLDSRSQVAYNFGRVNVGVTSPTQNFTESNIGVATTALPTFTASGNTTQFTLAPAANSNGTLAACAANLTSGAICNIQGKFSPSTTGPFTATYTQTGSTAVGSAPSITLNGLGAVLTTTTSTAAQTTPATGNSQFGGSVTLTATITPASCNTAAPSCFPTGTVSFVIGGTATAPVALGANGTASQPQLGLSVGPHTVSCNYSGDDFYAASSCGTITITVVAASTTSTEVAGPNNQTQFPITACMVLTQPPGLKGDTQCTATTLTATVKSNTTGSPTGTVTFYGTGGALGATPVSLGSASLDPSTGAATVALSYTLDANHILAHDPATGLTLNSSLPPGTYSLTCSYSGASNYAASNCAAVSITILPQVSDFTLVSRGCAAGALAISGTLLTGEGVACNPGPESFQGANPLVTVAQGSTTDATIFINANNTTSGTFTFSCSGLPANSTCTFSPTSVTFTPSTSMNLPQAVDMTLWTDLQPGVASLATHSNISLALMLGWPITLLGFAGIIRFRRKSSSLRGLSLLALLLMITGSSMIFTGCGNGGPGAYKASLTPAGNYPITVTVKGPSSTHTTVVYWTVTSPGIAGQQ